MTIQYDFLSKPLLSTSELARLLGRSEEGLRFTARQPSELGEKLRAARVRIGRRVHYRTAQIAELFETGAAAAPRAAAR